MDMLVLSEKETLEDRESDAIQALNEFQLALVGGGSADVFCQ